MQSLRVVLAALLLVAGLIVSIDAKAATGSYSEAQRLYDKGEYKNAEGVLKKLVKADPKSARNHQLLGDVYRKQGMLKEAVAEYKNSERLGGKNAELFKSMGTTYKWMGNYRKARSYYTRALKLNPDDREAKEDLESLRLSRGIGVMFMAGGWEPDYTTESYELMLSYKGYENLDLYAGLGYADQVYYERTKYYAKGYYFYKPDAYFKTAVFYKNYDYPVATTPVPDSNSYDKVLTLEFEVSQWLTDDLRGAVIYEYIRPNFFHDPDTSATNHKVTAEAFYKTFYEPLRLKAFFAILRDPDPDRTVIKGSPSAPAGASTSVEYQTQTLFGGGAEYVKGKWEAELKYIPNRDLDSSYSWSILAALGYQFTDRVRGRFDYVHDKFSSKSNFSGETADVYLGSVFYQVSQSLDLGAGLKHLSLPTEDDDTAFVTLSYKTGLGF
jgi:tetratricopeptide (TPR) repeat protein